VRRAHWANQALTDYLGIVDFYASTAPHFPPALLDRIDRLAARLVVYPHSAAPIEGTPFRRIRIRGTNFILFYLPTEEGIEIARLFHARQDWRGL
jgi:plasmid stabilization system protein ParE